MMKRPTHPTAKGKRLRRFLCRTAILSALMLAIGVRTLRDERDDTLAAVAKQAPITAAYVYDRAGLSFANNGAQLDQLNYSFALLKNGRVSGSHWQSIGAYKDFIRRHPNILPVLSVGGWGADGFSQAAASAEGRALFVESALELMEAHGFLGIDIDWEYPCSSAAGIASDAADRENFTLLLRALREGLDALTAQDGKARRLCIAVGADLSLVSKIECAAVGGIVDQVNLMTYDMHNATISAHHAGLYTHSDDAPLSADRSVQAYLKAGIPARKLMIGAAFYGRTQTVTSTQNDGLYQPVKGKAGNRSYRAILQSLREASVISGYDTVAQAPYLLDGHTFVSYDDPTSIGAKGAYVRQNGLMGMMCWEYGGDVDGQLLAAMHEGLAE